MKSLKFLLPMAMFLFCQNLNGQELLEKWEQESIYFTTFGYKKDGQKYPFRNLKKEYLDSKAAMAEFKSYQRNRNRVYGILGIGMAAIFTAAVLQKEHPKTASGLLLGGSAFYIASVPISLRAGRQLQKSVWLHNRELLLPKN